MRSVRRVFPARIKPYLVVIRVLLRLAHAGALFRVFVIDKDIGQPTHEFLNVRRLEPQVVFRDDPNRYFSKMLVLSQASNVTENQTLLLGVVSNRLRVQSSNLKRGQGQCDHGKQERTTRGREKQEG